MKSKSKHWLISDTHFGHYKLVKENHRQEYFEKTIIDNLSVIGENDILYHLGDFALYDTKYWNTLFFSKIKAKKNILILGNHDRETVTWYYDRGWDSVCHEMTLNMFGKTIILTHIPLLRSLIDIRGKDAINVHGHIHDTNHRNATITDKHYPVIMEHEYKPILLRKLIGM